MSASDDRQQNGCYAAHMTWTTSIESRLSTRHDIGDEPGLLISTLLERDQVANNVDDVVGDTARENLEETAIVAQERFGG